VKATVESNFTFSERRFARSAPSIKNLLLFIYVSSKPAAALYRDKVYIYYLQQRRRKKTITFPKSLQSTDGEKRSTNSLERCASVKDIEVIS
jgi:hypothetical protein